MHCEAQPFSGRPAAFLDVQPLHRILDALDMKHHQRRIVGSRYASTSGSMSLSFQGRRKSAEADGVASTRKVIIKVLPERFA
jgi:hypothetical protein